KTRELLLLPASHSRTLFEDHVRETRVTQNVASEQAFSCPQLDQCKGIEFLRHLLKLPGQQLSEDGIEISRGVVIAFGADRVSFRSVVMNKDLLHVLGEGDRSCLSNSVSELLGERHG